MTLNEYQKKVHATAVEKGWWQSGDRNFGEICALLHSEVDEAFDEFELDNFGVYFNPEKPKKPEGAIVELIDFIVRVCDWAEWNEINLECGMELIEVDDMPECFSDCDYEECSNGICYETLCNFIHGDISRAFEGYREGKCLHSIALHFCASIERIFKWAELENIELWNVLILKALYNLSRPYRHGNKKA